MNLGVSTLLCIGAFLYLHKRRPLGDYEIRYLRYTHILTRKQALPERSGDWRKDMYGAILGNIIGSPFEFDRGFVTERIMPRTERRRRTESIFLPTRSMPELPTRSFSLPGLSI